MEDISCSVCLNQFHKKNVVPKVLLCSHTFCKGCIQKMLNSSPVCPVCRKKINQTIYPTNLLALQLIDLWNKSQLTSSVVAGKCPGEIKKVKSKVEKKIEILNAEIQKVNEQIGQSKGKVDRLNKEILASTVKMNKKQKMVESLQNELPQFESLELKVKDFDAGQTQRATVHLKDICLSDEQDDLQGNQSDTEGDQLPQGGTLTLEKKNFRNGSTFRAEVAQRIRSGERVFCFEDGKRGRLYGRVTHGEGGLSCHALALPEEEGLGQGVTLVQFQELAPPRSAGMESFLLLQNADSDGAQILIRIRLEADLGTHQFALLSTGEWGPCYKGAPVKDDRGGRDWGTWLRFFSLDRYMKDGREVCEPMAELSGDSRFRDCMKDEVVITAGDCGGFEIWKMKKRENRICIVGVVKSPSPAVFESFPKGGEMRVSDCGIFVPI